MVDPTRNQGTNALRLGRIDAAALKAHRNTWKPYLEGEDDRDWEWQSFVSGNATVYGNQEDQFLYDYSLWEEDSLEGLMLISGPHICVARENFALSAVYIEYVAIAPWNRPDVRSRGHCTERARGLGLGPRLMSEAIRKSVELGFGGVLAFHSEARAEDRYKQMFMRKCNEEPRVCGLDVESNCNLLEITSTMANRWMSQT